MNRLSIGTILMLALGMGCLKKSQSLLCQSNEDCAEGEACESVSGLCRPSVEPSSFEGGSLSGAFRCGLTQGGGLPSVPGVASVLLKVPQSMRACVLGLR